MDNNVNNAIYEDSELILRKIIEIDNAECPKIIPNNLNKLSDIYRLNKYEFADKLKYTYPFMSELLDNKTTLSGKGTINLINNLDISFSCLYNIKKQIVTLCECNRIIFCVFKSSKKLKNVLDFKEYFEKYLKDLSGLNFNKDNIIKVTNWDEFQKVDGKLNFRSQAVTENRPLSRNVAKKYKEDLEKICEEHKIDNNNYYWFQATHKFSKEKVININTLNNIDVKTNKLLQEIPFSKIKSETFFESDYKIDKDSNNIHLNKKINLITREGMKKTDILKHKDEYKINSKNDWITCDCITNEYSAQKLKAYRLIKGYDLIDMANIFGIGLETYRLLEIGHNKLSTFQMWKIENNLGILLENIVDIKRYY